MIVGAVPLSFLAGSVRLGPSVPGFTLHEVDGEGSEREHVVKVEFERAFVAAPLVHASLTGLDADGQESLRVSLVVRSIEPSGFELRVKTWLRSRLYAVEISWLAVGH